jgi:hypothetical protein
MRTSYRLLVLLLLGLVIVGCTAKRAPRPPRAIGKLPPLPPGPVTVGLDIGNLAPDIEAADLEGNIFRLSDYRGKVVLLDFWGNW